LLSGGRSAGAFDELIAAITLCQEGWIVTKDQNFRRILGLEVLEYLDGFPPYCLFRFPDRKIPYQTLSE
jgi:hypothetical protein